jgi:phosphatidylglycerophosphatase A
MNEHVHPPVMPPVVRPSLRFMLSHPLHVVALGFGSGLSPVAPGTAGTAFAWITYLFIADWLGGGWQMGAFIAVCTLLGWWACTVTASNMRVLDPGPIVWDEVVAFWIILWLVMPAGWGAQLGAFVLFRAFDTVKPGPIGWADDLFHGFGWRGGFGILFDDLVAAFCTLLVIAAWRFYS